MGEMLGIRYGISFHVELFDIFDLNANGIEDQNFQFVKCFLHYINFIFFQLF